MELQVGVKILLQNKEGKYLVVCRSAIKYPEPGAQWKIVGGGINSGISLIDNLNEKI